MIGEIQPAFVLLFGALLLTVVRGRGGQVVLVLLPVLGLANLLGWEAGSTATREFVGHDLVPVRVDKLSLLFGWLFHIAAIVSAIYALHVKDRVQLVSGLMYAGSAVGVAFAGDLLTLFVYWELLAVTSVFQIWASKTSRSGAVGIRYLIFHITSGMLLLAGAALQYVDTGSLAFDRIELAGLGPWLIFIAIGIKCAFPCLHTWLVESYPEATPTGTVFLSAFTTKAAVYALARAFPGTEELIYIGTVMALFPIFYAVLENDLRRVLSYSMINQIGFMVVGIGIGTPLAINGAVTHAFNDAIFKGLLFMSMGVVLFRTGKIKCSDLGGIYKSMPLSAGLCVVGAASISAFPLFSGFVSKSMVMAAAGEEGLLLVWLALLFASAGVLHHAGIKIPFFGFFSHDAGIRCKEAPKHMLAAMGIAASLCIFLGSLPFAFLYKLAPYPVEYAPYTVTHVVTQMQLLLFAVLAFTWLRLSGIEPPELRCVNLDFDWFYRKGGRWFYAVTDRSWNGLNRVAHRVVVEEATRGVAHFFRAAPPRFLVFLLAPYWRLQGYGPEEMTDKKREIFELARLGAFPIGVTACLAVVLLALLFFF